MIERVLLDKHARESEVEGVEEAFRRAGFEVEAEAAVEFRDIGTWGAASLPWVIYVTVGVPLGTFFLAGFMGRAGEDAWEVVKRWAQDVWAARDEPHNAGGVMNVTDSEGTRIVFSSELPEEALDALRGIDWESASGGDLYWDPEGGRWYVVGGDHLSSSA